MRWTKRKEKQNKSAQMKSKVSTNRTGSSFSVKFIKTFCQSLIDLWTFFVFVAFPTAGFDVCDVWTWFISFFFIFLACPDPFDCFRSISVSFHPTAFDLRPTFCFVSLLFNDSRTIALWNVASRGSTRNHFSFPVRLIVLLSTVNSTRATAIGRHFLRTLKVLPVRAANENRRTGRLSRHLAVTFAQSWNAKPNRYFEREAHRFSSVQTLDHCTAFAKPTKSTVDLFLIHLFFDFITLELFFFSFSSCLPFSCASLLSPAGRPSASLIATNLGQLLDHYQFVSAFSSWQRCRLLLLLFERLFINCDAQSEPLVPFSLADCRAIALKLFNGRTSFVRHIAPRHFSCLHFRSRCHL